MGLSSESALETLSRDERFALLSNRRRCDAIRYLSDERSLPLTELADRITASERARNPDAPGVGRRESVYVSLYHAHIPKLADADIVVYDPDSQRVALTDRGVALRSYLCSPRPDSLFWSQLFVGQSILWIAVSLAAWINVPLISAVSASWIVLLCISLFVVTSIGYFWSVDRRATARVRRGSS